MTPEQEQLIDLIHKGPQADLARASIKGIDLTRLFCQATNEVNGSEPLRVAFEQLCRGENVGELGKEDVRTILIAFTAVMVDGANTVDNIPPQSGTLREREWRWNAWRDMYADQGRGPKIEVAKVKRIWGRARKEIWDWISEQDQ